MIGYFRSAYALMMPLVLGSPALAVDMPGVTPSEIKVGGSFLFSGPALSVGLVGRGILAYVQSANDRGGIDGRRANYIVYNDAYSRQRLWSMFSKLGSPAIQRRRSTFSTRECRRLGSCRGQGCSPIFRTSDDFDQPCQLRC